MGSNPIDSRFFWHCGLIVRLSGLFFLAAFLTIVDLGEGHSCSLEGGATVISFWFVLFSCFIPTGITYWGSI